MVEIQIKYLRPVIKSYLGIGRPIMIWGAPGIGKSHEVKALARELAESKGKKLVESGEVSDKEFGFVDQRISQLDPSDIRGVPFPEGNNTKWLIPNWLPKGGEGLLFVDEINLAPPSIQASFYQLINDRRVGDYVLPDGWNIIAAGNRAIDKAHTFPMSAPLKNRFGHVELLVPTVDEWAEWALDNGITAKIVSFLKFKPTAIFKFDSKSKDNAFPTPRTWELASRLTEDIEGLSEEELNKEYRLISSAVGQGTAYEYIGYRKLSRQISVDEILKKPSKVKEIKDLGVKYTLVSGLTEKYRADKKNLDKILLVVKEMDEEFGMFLMRMMKGGKKEQSAFRTDLMKSKVWNDLYDRYGKYLL